MFGGSSIKLDGVWAGGIIGNVKGRESGMPGEVRWEEFFDPAGVVARLGCTQLPGDVVEFGCGYGSFSLPAARGLDGILHALDIDPEMVARTAGRAEAEGIANLRAIERDFVADGSGLADGSAVHAMLFNILHIENPVGLLYTALRTLRPDGAVSVIHWRDDIQTPRGPSPGIRPSPEQCGRWAKEAGFRMIRKVPLGSSAPWHFGLVLEK